jgi:hypothetical protein
MAQALSEQKNVLASSWRKTTAHGSRRTIHGAGRHVMMEKNPASLKLSHTGNSCSRRAIHRNYLVFFLSTFQPPGFLAFQPLSNKLIS